MGKAESARTVSPEILRVAVTATAIGLTAAELLLWITASLRLNQTVPTYIIFVLPLFGANWVLASLSN